MTNKNNQTNAEKVAQEFQQNKIPRKFSALYCRDFNDNEDDFAPESKIIDERFVPKDSYSVH